MDVKIRKILEVVEEEVDVKSLVSTFIPAVAASEAEPFAVKGTSVELPRKVPCTCALQLNTVENIRGCVIFSVSKVKYHILV